MKISYSAQGVTRQTIRNRKYQPPDMIIIILKYEGCISHLSAVVRLGQEFGAQKTIH
jgi:hypothetical protein